MLVVDRFAILEVYAIGINAIISCQNLFSFNRWNRKKVPKRIKHGELGKDSVNIGFTGPFFVLRLIPRFSANVDLSLKTPQFAKPAGPSAGPNSNPPPLSERFQRLKPWKQPGHIASVS
ncbi:MAG: hypothetical protein ACI87E_004584 [Mariniblastus sp.]|jgi:hypothetical protein